MTELNFFDNSYRALRLEQIVEPGGPGPSSKVTDKVSAQACKGTEESSPLPSPGSIP
jgi:hypothetical protein